MAGEERLLAGDAVARDDTGPGAQLVDPVDESERRAMGQESNGVCGIDARMLTCRRGPACNRACRSGVGTGLHQPEVCRLRVAVVFPGQGTQAPGMGLPWRDHPAWAVAEGAEKALGEPLTALMLDAPAEQLARTRDAQLAVLCTSLVAWEATRDHVGAAGDIVAFAGHSLGQVTALIASGAMSADDGVRFAARRAEATQAAADAAPGRMAALLGATIEQAEALCATAPGVCWVANDNAPGQVVIAGTVAGIEHAIAEARAHGVKRATPLNVGGAFHTPLMEPAARAIDHALAGVTWSRPSAPIVSNEDGLAYEDATGWHDRLVRHVTSPVQWRTTLETLAALGATHLVEVGHGSMIAGLAKRTIPDVKVINVATPDDIPAIAGAAS